MLELKNITKIYNEGQNNECIALQNINLTLPQTGFVFIEGQSGSGKTTLLNIIAEIDRPTEGEILNPFGQNSCSIVFQDFQLIDFLTVEENLRLVLDTMPTSKQNYEELIEQYGLKEILTHYPNQISGGQKQRVAIMRAVLQERPILLCDEPTGNLDEENSQNIANILKEESKKKLVIVVSHDRELFQSICNRHIKLYKKKIAVDTAVSSGRMENLEAESEYPINKKIKIPTKTKAFLSRKFFIKSLAKNLLTLFSLFFSFLLLLSSVNGLLNTKGNVLYNAYKDARIEVIDFVHQGDASWNNFYSMSEEEYTQATQKYDVVSRFVRFEDGCTLYPFENNDKNISIYKMYIADTCDRILLSGDEKIDNGEVLVSDYLADILLEGWGVTSYDDLIGRPLIDSGRWKVGGVFETGIPYQESDGYYELEYFNQIAYINYQTLTKCNTDSCYVYMKWEDEYSLSGEEIAQNVKKRNNVVYGEVTELGKGEIGISKEFALKYTEDIGSLLGKTITVKFFNPRGTGSTEQLDKIQRTYTVKYIFNRGSMLLLDMSNEDYEDIAAKYNTFIFGYNAWGVSVANYTKKDVRELVSDGYTDHSYLSVGLSDGLDWFHTLYWIESVLGISLLVISIIIICNHVVASIDKEKRTLGVLVSLGIHPKEVGFIFLLSLFVGIIFCLALVSVVEILVIYGLNTLTMTMGITTMKTLFYEPLSVIFLLIMCVCLLTIFYFVVTKKLERKQIVDIIYER